MIIDKKPQSKAKDNYKHPLVAAYQLFPRDAASQKILTERANQLALEKIDENIQAQSIPYIMFTLNGDGYYGVPYQLAREVMLSTKLAKIPNTPVYVAGVINRRGSLLTVIDLNQYLHIGPADKQAKYIIIVEVNDIKTGLLAENIHGSGEYSAENFKQALLSASMIDAKYISGLADGRITILNLKEIISSIHLDISR